jgi:hypothetical protein
MYVWAYLTNTETVADRPAVSSEGTPHDFHTDTSAQNGNLEVPVYFLEEKHGYTVRR